MPYTPDNSAAVAQNRKCHWSHKPPADRTIERFAEALAEHGTVNEASKAIGITKNYGRALLIRIRRRLGVQAR